MENKIIYTKEGFGECLRAGLECSIIRQSGESVIIQLLNGDVWHGKVKDLMILDTDISHLIPLQANPDYEQNRLNRINELIRRKRIEVL